MKVTVKNWHAVASWTWTTEDDVCGICHMPLDGCAPGAAGPGDDSPVVWGRVRLMTASAAATHLMPAFLALRLQSCGPLDTAGRVLPMHYARERAMAPEHWSEAVRVRCNPLLTPASSSLSSCRGRSARTIST